MNCNTTHYRANSSSVPGDPTYRKCGGHAAIRTSLHDGIKLPRLFREHGFKTDLFDITEVAQCRMYNNGRAVFAGLAKNATEGLAAPARILPITALLGLGQVLPFLLLFVPGLTLTARILVVAACACALLPRLAAIKKFRQSALGALLHPAGVTALLIIQWFALARQFLGGSPQWRGRSYAREAMVGAWLLTAALAGAGAEDKQVTIRDFELNDQHDRSHRVVFPRTNCAVVLVADHKGSDQLEKWIRPVYERFGQAVAITGVANVSTVPPPLRGMVQRAFLKELDYPVLLDWQGDVVRQFTPTRNQANVYLVQTNGTVLRRWTGKADGAKLAELEAELRTRLRQP